MKCCFVGSSSRLVFWGIELFKIVFGGNIGLGQINPYTRATVDDESHLGG